VTTTSQPTPQTGFPLPRWWIYFSTVAAAIAVIGLILGVLGIYTNGRQDATAAAENKARDQYNHTLLDCFDKFATDLAGGLPPVRTATAAANDALAAALVQLKTGLTRVGLGTFTDDDLQRIIRAFDTYQHANDELTKVRDANPYPPPPSTFCSVG
jgi:hypothetical protein